MELDSKNIENLLQRLKKIGIEQKLIPAFMKDLANSLIEEPCSKLQGMFCLAAVLRATVRNSANFLVRSLTPQQAAGNALTVAVHNPNMNFSQVNERLHYIGWNDIELDYHTFQLAKECLSNNNSNC